MRYPDTVKVVVVLSGLFLSLTACDSRSTVTSSSSSSGSGGSGGSSQATGLTGSVTDTAGAAVADATVILIPSSDINTFTPNVASFAAAATDDEPLEDLVNDTTKSYQSATTDAAGLYTFTTVTAGNYFIYVKPATSDSGHLPGGSLCRQARDLSDIGADLDIEVSTAPSSSATYTGSTSCLTCHTGHVTAKKTGHFVGLRVPGSSSGLQDISKFTEFDEAITDKFTTTGTTIYYYDYDSTRGMDKYKTSETSSGTVSFTATVYKDGSTYKVRLNNIKNAADPNNGVTYTVAFTYGGAIYKQRYVTQIGTSYYTLPVQYQPSGSDSYSARTRKIWRDYNGAYWYNETTQLLTTPSKSKAFDNNCAGCHMTGHTLSGDDTNGWVATAVSDTNGTIDYDGDGDLEEINTGCEACHGPGSEHVAQAGAGKSIVQPGLITPERESMICGRCHARPKGALGTEVTNNSAGLMMLPGLSRAEFLANYTNGTQLDATSSDMYTDIDQHSKSHHQQYTDFIRSSHYKNRYYLMSCSDCHNPHGNDYERNLQANPATSAECTSCHNDKSTIATHTEDKTGSSTDMSAQCVDCHMPKTAKTGAGEQGAGSYWANDISSHLFKVPTKHVGTSAGATLLEGATVSDSLIPVPYTNNCGSACHDTDLSNN